MAEGRGLIMSIDTIDDWRRRIDAIDRKLVELFNERSRCAVEIGKIKRELKLEVIDPVREREVIRRAIEENQGPLDEDALRRLFECLIEEARRIE
jgi:chorismate mutase